MYTYIHAYICTRVHIYIHTYCVKARVSQLNRSHSSVSPATTRKDVPRANRARCGWVCRCTKAWTKREGNVLCRASWGGPKDKPRDCKEQYEGQQCPGRQHAEQGETRSLPTRFLHRPCRPPSTPRRLPGQGGHAMGRVLRASRRAAHD